MIVASQSPYTEIQRRRLLVRGQVQGVGFRPFVYRLAVELGLKGWVSNCGEGVELELQGEVKALRSFVARLHNEAPPQARLLAVEQTDLATQTVPPSFFIAPSRDDGTMTAVAVDTALCPACLAELFDPDNRRYRYPFINCIQCGPRFTISRALPFDRCNTTMTPFEQCPQCRREYQDPGQRRFHAQANACPACGPRLAYHDASGEIVAHTDVVAAAVTALRAGDIIALKGLGGFHLLCDARNAEAVARLRVRKDREAKPLAVMAANFVSSSSWVRCSPEQKRLLESAARPIILLEKASACDADLAGVAPGVAHLGVMLPYTPLHYLLFHEAAGRPTGTAWLEQVQALALVCTSANQGGEPLVTDNHEAFTRLYGIADGFVTHDRDISQRCDDSVMQGGIGAPLFIRRGRGFVPRSISLPHPAPPVLALGGDLKNTFCITVGDQAYVSQHNGDLDNGAARRALEGTLGRWLETLGIAPQCVVHDRHPDFFTTRLARRIATERDLPCLAVQHHHAHVAAVVAEHGLEGPVLGVVLDGFGLGDDHGLWGGELMRVEGAHYRRLGHLRQLALPGGDRAAREPWRMAASALQALGRTAVIRRLSQPAAVTVAAMLDKNFNAPLTSSAGRWFDAAAALLGITTHNSHEGQAAMQLESLAWRHGAVAPDPDGYSLEPNGVVDLLPLLDRLAGERDPGHGAALFHATLAAALSQWVREAARRESLHDVVLNGGCFMNRILRQGLVAQLQAVGLAVHQARQVPPNDGGLSLGQAWLGCMMLAEQDGERA